MVICVERGADLHMAQLMPLPLTVSCSSKIQIGFTFLVPAYPGCPGKEAIKWLCSVVYWPLQNLDVTKFCDLESLNLMRLVLLQHFSDELLVPFPLAL